MKIKIFFLLFVLLSFLNCQEQNKSSKITFSGQGKINYQLSSDESSFLDSLQYNSFLFFLNEINPDLGLVKDRTAEWAAASIAAIGFAIPAYVIGAERKWLTREKAAEMTLRILKFFYNSEQSDNTAATGYKGFYYHFLDMKTGKRTWNSELSTIDTGLLIAGIIFARQYYNLDNNVEKEIRDYAAKLVERLDWDFFIIKEKGKYENSICMGWYPERGFHNMGWKGYNEAIILYIIAAGCDIKDAESSFNSWVDSYNWDTPYEGFSHVVFPPLFGHQYSHMFVDFRNLPDDYMRNKGIDYFENSRRAAYIQRQYAIDNPMNWAGYDSLCWGLTACDGPGESFNKNGMKFLSYAGRGTSGPELVYFDDGTIAPTAAAGSIVFSPEIVIPTLMNIHKKYSNKGLWGTYGFYDSFNPTLNWFNSDYIGIDQGPIVIMIENFRTGLVWEYFMKDPVIQKGLNRLGFKKLNK